MKSKMLFIGIGQGGSNIVSLLEKEKYSSFYINTSYEDLELIESKFKYHVPGGRGCNKDREKALDYAKSYYQEMTNRIINNFPSQEIVYLVFTLGGGTGSGLGPILLEILSMQNPDKKYNAVVVLPSANESLQSRVNAIEGYKELSKVEGLNSIFVLDNNKDSNKLKINSEFVDLMESAINIPKADERGIIDNAELELLLTTKGSAIIRKTENKTLDNKLGGNDLNFSFNFKSNIFSDYERGCKYIGLSTNSVNDIKEIEELEVLYGKPLDTFVGYNDKETIAIASGMSLPKRAIYELAVSVEKDKRSVITNKTELNIEVPSLGKEEIKEVKKEKDIGDLFKKYTR